MPYSVNGLWAPSHQLAFCPEQRDCSCCSVHKHSAHGMLVDETVTIRDQTEVWSNLFVSPNGESQCVENLRKLMCGMQCGGSQQEFTHVRLFEHDEEPLATTKICVSDCVALYSSCASSFVSGERSRRVGSIFHRDNLEDSARAFCESDIGIPEVGELSLRLVVANDDGDRCLSFLGAVNGIEVGPSDMDGSHLGGGMLPAVVLNIDEEESASVPSSPAIGHPSVTLSELLVDGSVSRTDFDPEANHREFHAELKDRLAAGENSSNATKAAIEREGDELSPYGLPNDGEKIRHSGEIHTHLETDRLKNRDAKRGVDLKKLVTKQGENMAKAKGWLSRLFDYTVSGVKSIVNFVRYDAVDMVPDLKLNGLDKASIYSNSNRTAASIYANNRTISGGVLYNDGGNPYLGRDEDEDGIIKVVDTSKVILEDLGGQNAEGHCGMCFDDVCCWPVWGGAIVFSHVSVGLALMATLQTAQMYAKGLLSKLFFQGGGLTLIQSQVLGLVTGAVGLGIATSSTAGLFTGAGAGVLLGGASVLVGLRGAGQGAVGGGALGVGLGLVIASSSSDRGFLGGGEVMVVFCSLMGLMFGGLFGFTPFNKLHITDMYNLPALMGGKAGASAAKRRDHIMSAGRVRKRKTAEEGKIRPPQVPPLSGFLDDA